MADLDPLDRFLIEQEARSAGEPWQLIADAAREATRRLHFDPLLAARARAAAGVLREERRTAGGGWDRRDEEIARAAAALALVIAERPELITGQPTDRQDPGKVLAGVLAPLLLGLTGQMSRTVGEGWQDAEGLARRLLESLEAAGWEVTWRADRFATLERDAPRLRIPLRGTCGACHGPVDRVTELVGADAELLIGPWQHSYRQGTHPDTEIRDVTPR